jgi:uncharacterized protein YdhG (YjbR/CyaY superfamily)
MNSQKFKNIDEYISQFPADVQEKLKALRSCIHKAVPNLREVISYQMPAFKARKVLVYFAAYKNHIGFYPTSSGIRQFKSEFGNLKFTKGAVQFPLDMPLPLDIIKRITIFRYNQDCG